MTSDRQRIKHIIDLAERLALLRESLDRELVGQMDGGLSPGCKSTDTSTAAPSSAQFTMSESELAQPGCDALTQKGLEIERLQAQIDILSAVVMPAVQARAAIKTFWATVVLSFATVGLIVATVGAVMISRT